MKGNRYDHMTDAELLDLYYHDKSQQWIGILLERYTLLLLGVCMKYLKDENEAKDCVQQIFLKVLTEVGKYRIDFFKSWLYMVAKNHCLMRLRDKGAKTVKELPTNLLGKQSLEHPRTRLSIYGDSIRYKTRHPRRPHPLPRCRRPLLPPPCDRG